MSISLTFALLLSASPAVDFSPSARAQALGYVVVNDDRAKPFCENPQNLRSTEELCARKPSVATTHWRPHTKLKDATWTVRFDVLLFVSDKEALLAREQLIALVGATEVKSKNGKSQLTLSWCPRSYFWSGSSVVVVSAGCGGERPMCAVSRAFAEALTDGGSEEPWGILGFEGGFTVLGRGPDAFARCR